MDNNCIVCDYTGKSLVTCNQCSKHTCLNCLNCLEDKPNCPHCRTGKIIVLEFNSLVDQTNDIISVHYCIFADRWKVILGKNIDRSFNLQDVYNVFTNISRPRPFAGINKCGFTSNSTFSYEGILNPIFKIKFSIACYGSDTYSFNFEDKCIFIVTGKKGIHFVFEGRNINYLESWDYENYVKVIKVSFCCLECGGIYKNPNVFQNHVKSCSSDLVVDFRDLKEKPYELLNEKVFSENIPEDAESI